VCLFVCVSAASFPCARPLLPSSARSAGQRNQPSHSTVLARPVCLFVCESASFPCARPLLPSSARSAGQRNQPSHSTVLARPVCPFVCVIASFPCARPLLPPPDRSAGQRNQPSHSTVLARPVCLFVCESASFPCVKVPGSSRVPCPPLSSPSHANSFVIGPAVIKHTSTAWYNGRACTKLPQPRIHLRQVASLCVAVAAGHNVAAGHSRRGSLRVSDAG